MEDEKVLLSSEWRTRLEKNEYQNWVKVGYVLQLACKGIRPYVEREAKSFHGILLAKGLPVCKCVYTSRRRPSPHHDMANCDWAKELSMYHTKNPTWNNSDQTKWTDANVGFWEVSKVFMPYGCATGKVCANDTDATGLLNLLQFCTHFKTNNLAVERLKNVRNMWAHAAQQELSQAQTDDAFDAIKDLLQDPELISDSDAQNALVQVTDIENGELVDFKDVEAKMISILKKSILSAKDELIPKLNSIQDQEESNAEELQDIKEEISQLVKLSNYCITGKEEQDETLRNIQMQLEQIMKKFDQKRYLLALRVVGRVCWLIVVNLLALYLTLPQLVSSKETSHRYLSHGTHYCFGGKR